MTAEKIIEKPKISRLQKFFDSLHKSVQKLIIIDKNDQRATIASEKFPSVSVFKADITDESFIEEENISSKKHTTDFAKVKIKID